MCESCATLAHVTVGLGAILESPNCATTTAQNETGIVGFMPHLKKYRCLVLVDSVARVVYIFFEALIIGWDFVTRILASLRIFFEQV